MDIEPDDGEAEVSFMETKRDKLQWPRPLDVIWVQSNDIVCIVEEPLAVGRNGRMFVVRQNDINKWKN